jgi:glyoxylate reductase
VVLLDMGAFCGAVPPRVNVTAQLPASVQDAVEQDFELVPDPHGADGVVAMLNHRVDAAYLDAAGPQLRVVANFAVGLDNVDLDAARDRGVTVTNTPDVLTGATAELALALILALLRRVAEGDRLVRRGDQWGWEPTFMLGEGLAGKVLGIVGPGRIGLETARLGEALGMRVVTAGRGQPLDTLLREADVVSLHAPLTGDTHHLIGAEELAQMRETAVLVNTARGALVDEVALVQALREGTIAGAALDVYETEPHVRNELKALENVVLTPHIGSATRKTREAMGMLCVDALRAVLLEGRRPTNAVV